MPTINKNNGIEIDLTGPDGNAYAILALAKRLCKEFNIDPLKSLLVGDKESDIQAGISANISKSIFYGANSYDQAYMSVSNLLDIKEELVL